MMSTPRRTFTLSILGIKTCLTLTATKLVREWIDLHAAELDAAWQMARSGKKIMEIEPLR